MKIGIVSDLHCNVAGLQAALDLMGDVDELLCCGDIVLQVRFSNEVIRILRERGARCVIGNHDVEYLKRVAHLPSQRGIVDEDLVAWLAELPETIEMDPAGKRLLMVHSTPWTYDYVFPGSREMRKFAEVDADFVLGGHTHALFSGRIGRALVVNPGSTGHSVVRGADPTLSCAVLDTVSDEVRLLEYPEV